MPLDRFRPGLTQARTEEMTFAGRITSWTLPNLGLYMSDHFLKHNINFGAPLIVCTGDVGQWIITNLTSLDFSHRNRLWLISIMGQSMPLFFLFPCGQFALGRIDPVRFRWWNTGVTVVLVGLS